MKPVFAIIDSKKIGNEKKCLYSVSENKSEDYCNLNFASDPIEHANCKNKENFCYFCCENEFGEMHIDERENCVAKCEKIETIDSTGNSKFN